VGVYSQMILMGVYLFTIDIIMNYKKFFKELKTKVDIELEAKYQELLSEGVEDVAIRVLRIIGNQRTSRFLDVHEQLETDLEHYKILGLYFTDREVLCEGNGRSLYYNFFTGKSYSIEDIDSKPLTEENCLEFEKVIKNSFHKSFRSEIADRNNAFSNENLFLIKTFL